MNTTIGMALGFIVLIILSIIALYVIFRLDRRGRRQRQALGRLNYIIATDGRLDPEEAKVLNKHLNTRHRKPRFNHHTRDYRGVDYPEYE